jgi:anti-sigma B factor antagonist
MKFTVDKQEQYTILKLEEDKLDSTLSPNLKSEFVNLNTQGTKNLIVNLSNTRYSDSSGLSALLTGNRTFSEAGGEFILTGLQPMVEKLIAISQLDKVLNILPTDHEGIENIMMSELEKEMGNSDDSAE